MEGSQLEHWEFVRGRSEHSPGYAHGCKSHPQSRGSPSTEGSAAKIIQLELRGRGPGEGAAVGSALLIGGVACGGVQVSMPKIKIVCTRQAVGWTAGPTGAGTGDHLHAGSGSGEDWYWILTNAVLQKAREGCPRGA